MCLRSSLSWLPNHVLDLNLSAFVWKFTSSDFDLLFLSCEEVSILWIFISLELSGKPSNSNNFTWLTLLSRHFWNTDSHWQYFTSPQSQPAFPSAHSWAALFPWVLQTSHQLRPGGRFSAHRYSANLCLTKVPASPHSCLAGCVPYTSEMTCCGPWATSLLINETDAEPSSSANSTAPQQWGQGHHGDPERWVTRGAPITQRQRQWQETSKRE